MDQQEFKEIEALFGSAIELPLAQRMAYVRSEIPDRPDLQNMIKELLDAYEEAATFMDLPLWVQMTGSSEVRPRTIGGYSILETLGEGGMGKVYLAKSQTPPRKVALKLLKNCMASPDEQARFQLEYHALARLDHPNLAKVFDAGQTEEGFPFFTMEYFPGIPVTDFCRRHQLSLFERLNLFTEILLSIQHAHQRGLIHRDLKPNNILAAHIGDKPTAKVIDFGIVKEVGPHMEGVPTVHTARGHILGSPVYMSPEQLLGTEVIDIRSDIYSLGAVLYEILTDTCHVDVDAHKAMNPASRLDSLIRENPPIPHQKVSAQSIIRPSDLTGSLDWIVMKAMHKDRRKRYPSISSFIEDLSHFREKRPVQAAPDGWGYRLRLFLVRNHFAVTIASMALLFLLILVTVTSVAYFHTRATLAELAIENQRNRAMRHFLKDLLTSPDPNLDNRQVKVVSLLNRASDLLPKRFEETPVVEASMHEDLGSVYLSLGYYQKAGDHFESALELYTSLQEKSKSLRAMAAQARRHFLQRDYEQAEEIYRTVLRRHGELTEKDAEETSIYNRGLGNALQYQNRLDEALALYLTAFDLQRNTLGMRHPETLITQRAIANVFAKQGKTGKARELYQETLSLQQEVLGPQHPQVLTTLHNFSLLLTGNGEYAEAESLLRRIVLLRKDLLGDNHPRTLESQGGLAWTLGILGRNYEAQEIYEQALEKSITVNGLHHSFSLSLKNNLAGIYFEIDRLIDAERLYGELYAYYQEQPFWGDSDRLHYLNNFADFLIRTERTKQAQALLESEIKGFTDHAVAGLSLLYARITLAEVILAGGDKLHADSLYGQAIKELRKIKETLDPLAIGTILFHYGQFLGEIQQNQRAKKIFLECRELLGEDAFDGELKRHLEQWVN